MNKSAMPAYLYSCFPFYAIARRQSMDHTLKAKVGGFLRQRRVKHSFPPRPAASAEEQAFVQHPLNQQ